MLLAYWNGKPAQGLGGTGDIVTYARAIGKPLIIIDAAAGSVTEERLDGLARPQQSAALSTNPREQVQAIREAFGI